jgi:uncharacterized protein YndB with AHSA1/START domain
MSVVGETLAGRSIVVDRILPYPPEKVWRALTQRELLQRWLMPSDFQPAVGHRFTFATEPRGDWDGVVHCEVLDCEPNRLLRYSWVGGVETNTKYGSRLDSVVTWTLTEVAGGTRLRMEHAGFRSPENDFAYNAMGTGWGRILDRIDQTIRADG